MTIWTYDRVETLKEMWAQGATASQISDVVELSRSSVIGKAHRLGLSARANPVATNEEKFERMVDLIADAPYGEELSIDFASKQVGFLPQTGRKMWREKMARFGRQLS